MADNTDQPANRPRPGPGARREAEQRRARQAAALRENLRRRKARERLHDQPGDADRPATGDPERPPRDGDDAI